MRAMGATALDEAREALPGCYSIQLESCLNWDNEDGLPRAQCDAINRGYAEDFEAMNARVQTLPLCSTRKSFAQGAVAGAAIAVAGFFVLRRLLSDEVFDDSP